MLNIEMEGDELNDVYNRFIKLADSKKDITDEDLFVLAGVKRATSGRRIKLEHLQVLCGQSSIPMATVTLNIDGESLTSSATGNGPIDAAFSAVKQVIQKKVVLEEFLIQAITRGSNDLGKVHVQIENKGSLYYGFSANTDIVTASVEAFIDAISKIR